MNRIDSLNFLERLLSSAGVKDSSQIARRITEEHGDINRIMHTDAHILEKASAPASDVIRLCAALTSRRVTDRYRFGKRYTDEELREYICALFLGVCVETVYVLLIDEGGRLAACECMGEGTVNSSEILPRRICDISVRRGCRRVIVAHNHPRGSAAPSTNDMVTTTALSRALQSVGIELVSNYVVSGFEISDCMNSLVRSL